jgi:hypothetical protein
MIEEELKKRKEDEEILKKKKEEEKKIEEKTWSTKELDILSKALKQYPVKINLI